MYKHDVGVTYHGHCSEIRYSCWGNLLILTVSCPLQGVCLPPLLQWFVCFSHRSQSCLSCWRTSCELLAEGWVLWSCQAL